MQRDYPENPLIRSEVKKISDKIAKAKLIKNEQEWAVSHSLQSAPFRYSNGPGRQSPARSLPSQHPWIPNN
jgi:hypothetical protein